MVYAQPRIHPIEWDTQNSQGFWHTNRSLHIDHWQSCITIDNRKTSGSSSRGWITGRMVRCYKIIYTRLSMTDKCSLRKSQSWESWLERGQQAPWRTAAHRGPQLSTSRQRSRRNAKRGSEYGKTRWLRRKGQYNSPPSTVSSVCVCLRHTCRSFGPFKK